MPTSRDPRVSFAFGVGLLRAFYLREGHIQVPREHQEGYFALGLWVEDARAKPDYFTADQIAELSAFDRWSWGSSDRRSRSDRADFEKGLDELRKFAAAHGHTRVPQLAEGRSTPLGRWVKRRRREYFENTLSIDEIEALEAFPDWAWNQQQADFESHVASLAEYASEHRTTRLPTNFKDATGFGLGRWVAKQRAAYHAGELSERRCVQLAQVPFWHW